MIAEPTNREILGKVDALADGLQELTAVVQTGFGRVEIQLDRVENRLTKVEERLTGVEERLTGVEGDVRNLTYRVGSLEEKVSDMDETLQAVARAVDVDAVTIIDHEKRIAALEKERVNTA